MALFAYYQFAARPTLRKIAELISQKHPDVTGSPETVRRTLLGLSTPTRWNTVDAMLAVLSDLANMDPAAARPPLDDGSGESFNSPHKPKAEIRVLWNAALDAAPQAPVPEHRGALPRQRAQHDSDWDWDEEPPPDLDSFPEPPPDSDEPSHAP
ncbi:hypothetical protein [Streptomyces platensis]|uniref:hypothetical protein n=1 Tax=Streptomyces platensis TaxID=58346 RepID=UPI003870AC54|nr:hypothetical protein OG962_03840 [Streptomyces platensis]